ncbi:MAG: PilT/PilU family type 4a pilus ATPase [Burkholderiaceae bacterium]
MAMMDRLLRLMAERKASDLFLSPGSPIQLKVDGTTAPINAQSLDSAMAETLMREIVDERQWEAFVASNELNIGYAIPNVGSYRVNVFRQRGTPAAVVRYIPADIPTLEAVGMPALLGDLVMEKRGLILVVGATGSGKTTTIAAMLEHRNQHRSGHILTLEDPIEYSFRSKRSIVNQRQIGSDTESLDIALRNAMRQAPDCILIGEIRDTTAMSAAMAYAQSGHLVLATLHANNANHALNRIVSFYTPENRRVLLSDLSATLKVIVSQRLLHAARHDGRIPVVEILLNTRHIAELIEQGRLTEVKEAIEKSLATGSRTFDQELAVMVRSGLVSRDEALINADSPTNLLWLLENEPEALARDRSAASARSGSAAEPVSDEDTPSFAEFTLKL